jgi:hypothetical protein
MSSDAVACPTCGKPSEKTIKGIEGRGCCGWLLLILAAAAFLFHPLLGCALGLVGLVILVLNSGQE